ncbi:MAG: SDR family NAD(P)-dependent oxidoreductase [Bacteroidales bacterium]
MKHLEELIDISRFYGRDKNYTLAGGGNTSYKDDSDIWIKASGAELATITEDGFAQLHREKVKLVRDKVYSSDKQLRETEVKEDLVAANVDPSSGKRPSVETSFHELIEYAFVVHMHPTHTNALMCAKNARKETTRLFGDEVMYIEFAPGYELFLKLKEALKGYREKFKRDPKIIFLENHGIFVSADTTEEIRELYEHVTGTILTNIEIEESFRDLDFPTDVDEFLPAIRMLLSDDKPKSALIRHNTLHSHFYKSAKSFEKAARPFTPDIIVYCKAAYMYIEDSSSAGSIITSFRQQLPAFVKKYGYSPKIIMIRDHGVVAVEDSAAAAATALEVYEDLLKVSLYSESFGGPHFLESGEIEFIDNWEVENYRRKVSMGEAGKGVVDQRVVIVTGAAQGFGEGIAEALVENGANVVVADLHEENGIKTALRLSALCKKNRVIFQHVDVADPASVETVVENTVKHFGGIDVFISNAGILHAGGVDELTPVLFEKMTQVNYNAWFYCVRAASKVMKIQSEYKAGYTMDLIQINSKSGLEGSNRNFAYAGAKFGGIGLTQSFALELAPFGIKVNAVCPGNFFEGPLWSDPEKGLFVQYLEAGKVPGARSVEDVKAFYEDKVPMKRGCRVDDVMKAIYYIIEQQYETGQAVPVTGGQVMLR